MKLNVVRQPRVHESVVLFVTFCIILAQACLSVSEVEQGSSYSKLVYPGEHGKLMYTPDENGNTVPDFSNAGYMGGGVRIPNTPVRITLEPNETGEDDTARIQAAIDRVSEMRRDERGLRGAVLLEKGTYRISGTIYIRAGGVALRGKGQGEDGTVLVATGRRERTLIQVGGDGSWQEVRGTRRRITHDYVPVGVRSLQVGDASRFAIGDTVIVHRPSTREWIYAIRMDNIKRSHPGVNNGNRALLICV